MADLRIAIRSFTSTVALGLAAVSVAPAVNAQSDIYEGYSGEEFLFNGAGHSGTLQSGIMDTIGADFAERTGVRMAFDTFCCGIARLQAAQESGNVPWDIVAFSTMSDLRLAQEAGLLLEIDPAIVPVDRLEPGTYDSTAIYGYPYAAVVAWNTDKWPMSGEHPTKLADVLDSERFPGKRCLYNYPQFGGTLEAALLADGVAPEDLYPMDLKRALTSLNGIRDDIVWWTSGSQGVQQLASGQCDIALVWNGPVSEMIRQNDAPFAIGWGNAIWDYTPVTIPKGVENEKAAQAFLHDMIDNREAQKKFVEQTAYLLMPLKEQVPISEEVRPWVLAGENAETAILQDSEYYMDNIATLLEQFNEWVVTGTIPE